MRIGICINALQDMRGKGNGGIGVYIEQLIAALLEADSENTYVLIRDRPLPGSAMNPRVREMYFPYSAGYYPLRMLGLWREWVVPHEGIQVLHETMSNSPPWRCSAYPMVMTVHDLIPWLYPSSCQGISALPYRFFMPANLHRAAAIISTSENTQQDLLAYEPRIKNKVRVIPLAAQPLPFDANPSAILNVLQIKGPYLLAVSTLEPRKNHLALLDAFILLKDRHPDLQLVLVGPKGWKNQPVFNHPALARYEKDIILAGYVNRDDLAALYRHTQVFIYPSLYEGFGLPPLEAAAAGAPLIVGRNSSLPEVLGDVPFYVSAIPRADEIADTVQYIWDHPLEKDKHVLLGVQRAQEFTWSRTALATLEVYEDAVRGKWL